MAAHLAPYEVRLVREAMNGNLNKEIAHRMGYTEQTVKIYLGRIYRKLGFWGAGSRVKLALWAREHAELLNAS